MCGIAGFLELSRRSGTPQLQETVMRMADTLYHRGPDDGGVWVDAEAGVALGHRRLSILDLSQEGHQPMHSACGRYVIVFNGEIYNFKALRRELDQLGYPFRGHSDTEVLLAAVRQWGVEGALPRLNGMFAFALWDQKERILHLVRDRLGEKPLYYGWMGMSFLFGSELKALRAHPHFKAEINCDVMALYLRHNYIPAPYSIYQGLYKLLPGTILTIKRAKMGTIPQPTPYWSVKQAAEQGIMKPFQGSTEEAASYLDILLRDAVKLRMEADVPLGAFLSGGIDSSTVVALMQVQSNRAVQTFSIGFYEARYNEADLAKAVAKHIGTEHTELYVTPEEAMAVVPHLPKLYDEPFADSSQIPTFLLSKLSRRHVTVSLSGDGGDELFAGYHRYLLGRRIWSKMGWMPKVLRSLMATGLTKLSSPVWKSSLQKMDGILPEQAKPLVHKLDKLAEILVADNPETMYRGLISHWNNPASLARGACEPPTALTDRRRWANLPDFTRRMMYLDTITYLPDDILAKVDRASMGVNLEVRVPFLDHRVVEFAWTLPIKMKICNGKEKWLLRQLLHHYVPKELIERPKMGLGVPIDSWLRGPLREWAESLLDEKRLEYEGFFYSQPIRQKWLEHISGKYHWHYYLWNILMFQAWLGENKNSPPPSGI